MSDYIEYLDDLEKNQAPVGPDQLAPEPETPEVVPGSGIIYDERKDPEVKREAIQNRKNRLYEARLFEITQAERILNYVNSTGDETFEGFMDSEYSQPNDTADKFERHLTYHKKRGDVGQGIKIRNMGGKAYSAAGGVTDTKKKNKPEAYERDENYEVKNRYATDAADLSKQYAGADVKGSSDEMFQDVYNVVKNIIMRTTDKRHALIYGDPGIGKTHIVMETCDRFMPKSPIKAKYCYEAGDIGTSMSNIVPFFYFHSKNEIIVLDDNDKMVMKGQDQSVMNMMKAILDPKAAKYKPITVRVGMMKLFNAGLSVLQDAEDQEKKFKMKEGCWIEVDTEALKENRFIVKVDDEPVIDQYISLRESQKLQNKIRPLREEENYENIYAKDLRHIREASNKEFLDDLIGGEEDDEMLKDAQALKAMKDAGADEYAEEGDGAMPRKFFFNSSVIFVSNLEMNDINNAVLDRTESVEVKLTLKQYHDRLKEIYKGLALINEGTFVNDEVRKWSKDCIFTVIGIAIDCWQQSRPVFGSVIEINRKLTFRMFDEFVSAWERYASDLVDRNYGVELSEKMSDRKFLDKLGKDLIPIMFRRKVIPWLKTYIKIE